MFVHKIFYLLKFSDILSYNERVQKSETFRCVANMGVHPLH